MTITEQITYRQITTLIRAQKQKTQHHSSLGSSSPNQAQLDLTDDGTALRAITLLATEPGEDIGRQRGVRRGHRRGRGRSWMNREGNRERQKLASSPR